MDMRVLSSRAPQTHATQPLYALHCHIHTLKKKKKPMVQESQCGDARNYTLINLLIYRRCSGKCWVLEAWYLISNICSFIQQTLTGHPLGDRQFAGTGDLPVSKEEQETTRSAFLKLTCQAGFQLWLRIRIIWGVLRTPTERDTHTHIHTNSDLSGLTLELGTGNFLGGLSKQSPRKPECHDSEPVVLKVWSQDYQQQQHLMGLVRTQILRPLPSCTEPQTLGVGTSKVCFNNLSRRLWCPQRLATNVLSKSNEKASFWRQRSLALHLFPMPSCQLIQSDHNSQEQPPQVGAWLLHC